MIDATQRIEAALAQLGAEYEPPPGWEARVLAATRATPQRSWWTFAVPGLAFAAAAVCAVQLWPAGPPPALALDVQVRAAVPVRGPDARVGDVAHIAVSGGAGERAVWVYREELQLVIRCPGDPGCAVSDAGIQLDLPLSRIGTYTIIALTGGAGLPAPVGNYDTDTAAVRRAAGVELRESRLRVQ